MKQVINQRIVQLIETLGESNNRFAKRIGTSSAVISHIVTNRNKPNIDLLYKILNSLPNVNIRWLILGQGGMLLDPEKGLEDKPEIKEDDLEAMTDKDVGLGKSGRQENNTTQNAEPFLDWDQFLNLMEQMLDSQKLAHQSMEQNLATQKEMIQWLRKFFKR